MASTLEVDQIKHSSGVAFTLPTADGSAGHLLKTDGSRGLSFTADTDTGILNVVEDTTPQLGGDLSCNGSQIQWSKGADVASATALVLLTDGNYFDVTGTVTVTSFNTTAIGTQIKLHFDAACLLTHHSTDLVLPGGANITTAAGDEAEFIEYASGDYRCTNYTKADGTAVVGSLEDESVDSDHYVDLSIDTAHIGNDQVTYAKIQNVVDDERILGRVSGADGVIEELTKAQVLTFANVEDGATADQSASEIKTLLEDGIDSVHYVDGSIDNEHIADDAINSEHYAAASIDAEHLAVGKDGALSLNGAPADHTANGPQTTTFNAGYTTVQSDLVYLGSSSTWLEADSDATGTSINLLGIALEVKDSGEALNVALPGSFIQDASVYNFTPGVPLYVSGTLGEITATKPTGSGDVVRTVGFAVHADMIYFNPSPDYVTLA